MALFTRPLAITLLCRTLSTACHRRAARPVKEKEEEEEEESGFDGGGGDD
jgi:hypothetical protein